MALIALIAIGPQAYLGYATNVAREEVNVVFAPSTTGSGAWKPATPTTPRAPARPRIRRRGGRLGGRVTVARRRPDERAPDRRRLGVGRATLNTDTLIVASLDPVTDTVSLLSLERDMVDVPLPGGGTYSGKINSLLSYARLHPGEFPGSSGDGHDVLMAAVGTLLGLDIEQWAQVDLGGFVAVVDSLGGVDVNVAHSFCDPTYHEYGFTAGFAISAGRHHLDGQQALAYARVRKAAGESDFTRQARQQEIISGVRDAVVKGGFLNDPIGFLEAIGQTVQTNIPRSVIVPLADVARRVDRTRTYRAVVTYPLVRPGFDVRGSIQLPDVAGIRALAASLFPAPGRCPRLRTRCRPTAARASGSGVSSCLPAPTPRPSAKPTAAPEPRDAGRLPGGVPGGVGPGRGHAVAERRAIAQRRARLQRGAVAQPGALTGAGCPVCTGAAGSPGARERRSAYAGSAASSPRRPGPRPGQHARATPPPSGRARRSGSPSARSPARRSTERGRLPCRRRTGPGSGGRSASGHLAGHRAVPSERLAVVGEAIARADRPRHDVLEVILGAVDRDADGSSGPTPGSSRRTRSSGARGGTASSRAATSKPPPRPGSTSSRRRVAAIAAGLLSAATQRLPSPAATAGVVPDPAKRSATRSPGSLDASMSLTRSDAGFWVG